MGKYENTTGTAQSIDWGETPNTHTKYVSVVFDTPIGAFEWKGWFSEKASERTIKSLQLMGCTFPGGDITNTVGFDRNEVSLSIEDDPEYGKSVAFVNAPGSVREENRLTGPKLAGFAASMKGTLLRMQQNGGAKPAPAKRRDDFLDAANDSGGQLAATGTDGPAHCGNGGGSDDIPF